MNTLSELKLETSFVISDASNNLLRNDYGYVFLFQNDDAVNVCFENETIIPWDKLEKAHRDYIFVFYKKGREIIRD